MAPSHNLEQKWRIFDYIPKIFSEISFTIQNFQLYRWGLGIDEQIVPFHKDFSPSGKQLGHRKLAQEL